MSLHSDRASQPDDTDGPDAPDPAVHDDGSESVNDAPSLERRRSVGSRVRAASLEAQVDLLTDERERLEREVDRLEETVTRLETEVRSLEDALDRKEAELDGVRSRYEEIVAEKDRANQRLREESTASRSRVRALVSRLAGLVPGW